MQSSTIESQQLSPTHSVEPAQDTTEPDFAHAASEARDPLEQEALILNLDASLRVHARSHFFTWTQGLLQSLLGHEALICALRNGAPPSLRVDSFSMLTPDPATLSAAFLRDSAVAPGLIKTWEERRFRPLVLDAADGSVLAQGSFSRELARLGATRLFVHGTHDAQGQMMSLFVFACAPQTAAPRHASMLQMIVPFLHSAWVRTQIDAAAKVGDASQATGVTNVTSREQEILKWIYLGTSNIEIGAILSISPLTVKNHVQKVLRKLNVVNRAQAIGKAMELRILRP